MAEHTRTLDFKIAFAMGLGTMIAAGIFSLSGTAVAQIGSSAVIAFIIAALVAGITAASYSEFASIYSENGGGYLFSSRTFEDRDLLTFGIGASLFLGYSGTTAFYLATMDEWFFTFILPEWLHFLPHGSIGVLAALLLGALNAGGTEESGTFQLIITGAKVAVLFAFIGGAFVYTGAGQAVGTFSSSFQVEPVGIISVAALAFITFFGFSAIAASAGEIIEPRKTVPKAIAASMITVTVLYTFVIIAMVNAPVADSVLQAGETAMGKVAAAFIGPIGQALIVAGAVFSMISASNASVLAGSGIGSLMGQQGQSPRRFARVHPKYGTPFWSITAVTATIVALIVVFITIFPHQGSTPFGIHLGHGPLTGFATLNLLLPLSAVNIALIVSRRNKPDIDRPLKVPLVPVLPALGVVANLALIYNLPTIGVILGAVTLVAVVGAYLLWGGNEHIDEVIQQSVSPSEAAAAADGGAMINPEDVDTSVLAERSRILVPVNRPHRAVSQVKLADRIGSLYGDDVLIQVLNVTQVPEQTPSSLFAETADGRVNKIAENLSDLDLDAEYTLEGHTSQDIAFDILHTAREDEADLILMGYPDVHYDVTERVEYGAPCDALFADSFSESTELNPVNIGTGGGPHHQALLPMIDRLAGAGSTVNVIDVDPGGSGGTEESADDTVSDFTNASALREQHVSADSVADGLVSKAAENGGVLFIGATRTRRLRRWLFGGTPDRVVKKARSQNVPVVVYATTVSLSGKIEDRLFPLYRIYTRLRERGDRESRDAQSA